MEKPKTEPSTVSEALDQSFEHLRRRLRPTPEDDAKVQAELQANEEAQRRSALEQARRQLERDLGERYSPSRASLETFAIYDDRQTEAIAKVKTFAANLPERVAQGQGLVLYGAVGTGKDHILAALLYQAISAGILCRWHNCQELYGALRDRMKRDEPEREFLDSLGRPQVLGLSDPTPPIDDLTAWRLEVLYRLVERRYHALRSTWLTINAESTEEVEAKLTSQIWDRLQESALVVPCFWPSYRERKRGSP
jgi:DNA replication protein DnaC